MAKSPDAFRTISEVADWLGVQAHVLRFWESKFTQVKPIKRAGGRRYYRPSDMLLLGGLKKLLHEDGLTIKGAQKLLREKGVAHVADLSQPLDDLTIAVIEGAAAEVADQQADIASEPHQTEQPQAAESGVAAEDDPEFDDVAEPVEQAIEEAPLADEAPEELERVPDPEFADQEPQEPAEAAALDDLEPVTSIEPEDAARAPEPSGEHPVSGETEAPEQAETVVEAAEETEPPMMPSFRARARSDELQEPVDAPSEQESDTADTPAQAAGSDEDAAPFEVTPPKAAETPAPKPRIIDVGPLPDLADFPAEPSALSALAGVAALSSAQADEIRPLLARLTRLRASMANPRKDVGKD